MRLQFSMLFCLIGFSLFAQSLDQNKISNRLMDDMENQSNQLHHICILLQDKVDVLAMDNAFFERKATLQERTFEVITALQAKATDTQSNLLDYLRTNLNVDQNSIHPYWITNVVFAKVKNDVVVELSNREDIYWIDLNGELEMTEYYQAAPPANVDPDDIEPGLAVVKAPELWEMGYTGYGRTAFGADTGIDPTHPSIKNNYRGHNVDPEDVWFQLNGNNTTPFDCDDHGTHTIGTVLGLDRRTHDTIGVAFNAEWIGGAILCGIGTEDNVAAFEWALNPDNDANTITDMPDVINNSWHDPSIDDDCNSVYVDVLNALEAVGVAAVFSAGNAGPDPMSITRPHNINTTEVNSFTVAALNGNNSLLQIADFSSRGPSQCPSDIESIEIKPEVSAPGVSVRSCVPGGYDYFSGTSMAAPHVCGALLLLKEAFPELTGTELKLALYHTCEDRGVEGEDNTFGMGLINTLAAFNFLLDAGHIPVSPYVANDILIIDVETNLVNCDSEFDARVFLENAGTDSVYSFDIVVELDGTVLESFSFVDSLAPGQRRTINLNSIAMNLGEANVYFELKNPNGIEDDRPLNNRLNAMVNIYDLESPLIDIEQTTTFCENAELALRLNHDESDATVFWYNSENSEESIGEGDVFVTPSLAESTTYYASLIAQNNIGITDVTDLGQQVLNDIDGESLVFDVYTDCTLKGFTMFTDDDSGRLVSILKEDGAQIHQNIISLDEPGIQVVEVDYFLPAGNNYRLKMDAGNDTYMTQGSIPYPFDIEGVISIKFGRDDDNDPVNNRYYYFYNWVIEYEHPCGRQSIELNPAESFDLPTAEFSSSDSDIDLAAVSGEINFANNSSGFTSSFWNFGDGNTSTENAPSHIYTEPGTYFVSLVVQNDDGCTDAFTLTITVVDTNIINNKEIEEEQDVLVLPNPTNGMVTLQFSQPIDESFNIDVVDVMGRRQFTQNYNNGFVNAVDLDLNRLSPGIYYCILQLKNSHIVKKIVKL